MLEREMSPIITKYLNGWSISDPVLEGLWIFWGVWQSWRKQVSRDMVWELVASAHFQCAASVLHVKMWALRFLLHLQRPPSLPYHDGLKQANCRCRSPNTEIKQYQNNNLIQSIKIPLPWTLMCLIWKNFPDKEFKRIIMVLVKQLEITKRNEQVFLH